MNKDKVVLIAMISINTVITLTLLNVFYLGLTQYMLSNDPLNLYRSVIGLLAVSLAFIMLINEYDRHN